MRLLAVTFLLSSCLGATYDQLVRRAAFDFACPEAQVQVVELDSRTRGAMGCGQRATYIEDCRMVANSQQMGSMSQVSTSKTDCTWVMNTDVRRDP